MSALLGTAEVTVNISDRLNELVLSHGSTGVASARHFSKISPADKASCYATSNDEKHQQRLVGAQ
jgi:hypothetical protein